MPLALVPNQQFMLFGMMLGMVPTCCCTIDSSENCHTVACVGVAQATAELSAGFADDVRRRNALALPTCVRVVLCRCALSVFDFT
jgi:hypothetical protein